MSATKPASKKPVAKKPVAKKPVAKTETPVEEVKQEEAPVQAPASKSAKKSAAPKKPRVRRIVTRESLEADFTTLQKRVEDEIEKLRQSTEKVKGVKFLRSVNKAVKVLRSDSLRVLKIKPKTNRSRSTTSGFMKPVGITADMAKFTGWDATKLYSRVDVTKYICKYIRENELQNAADRRQILVDDKLKALLNYDPANPPMDKNGKPAPLTYFRLQQYIQPHFVKDVVGAVAAAVPETVVEDEETVDVEEADE
ncbi:MAG: SWIB/MDM2 domain-containing protein [Candidatus Colwellbacteria bacterium]|nr:SWIB/MDM2 domain-containing protein [Candidatus Colwellbacteria bacterium]